MATAGAPVRDEHGQVMFLCGNCAAPISVDDFFELGLRLPDRGESAGEYRDAELLDRIDHVDCPRAARAG